MFKNKCDPPYHKVPTYLKGGKKVILLHFKAQNQGFKMLNLLFVKIGHKLFEDIAKNVTCFLIILPHYFVDISKQLPCQPQGTYLYEGLLVLKVM